MGCVAGGAEAALAAVAAGKALHRDEAGSGHGQDDELGDPVAGGDRVRRRAVGVEQDDADLAAVAGVQGAGRVDDRDAVLGGEAAARDDEGRRSRRAGRRPFRCRRWRARRARARPSRWRPGRLRRRPDGRTRGRARRSAAPRRRSRNEASPWSNGSMPNVPAYRERLWPAPWVFLATALVIPASLLVFLPISLPVGRRGRGRAVWRDPRRAARRRPPTIEVDERRVPRGPGPHRPRQFVGRGSGVRGRRGDGRARRAASTRAPGCCCAAGSPGVVRVEIDDPDDPTPYWLVSSRRPARAREGAERA